MAPRFLLAAVLAFFVAAARAQGADPNWQNLLVALVNGAEVLLVTPLSTGELQVTSFRPSVRLSTAAAQAALQRAAAELRALGAEQPTADQAARVLAGGPLSVGGRRYQAPGILAESGWPAAITSQVVSTATPIRQPGNSAAAGGSAPAMPEPLRDAALRQLASLGILNPSEDQIQAAIVGGTLQTLNGPVQLPGLAR